ncbi:MAG: 4a-hydroxytetrahydrobiopterin dehydratase [Rubrobacter sp.]|nr:4a-hydroxytetrahydrobiopterin dehydratase [Rubrobacter sp.]
MEDLANITCQPCRSDTPPLAGDELGRLSRGVPEWDVVEGHHLRREFCFRNFGAALKFVERVGTLAEEQGHHPDIRFGWGYAEITVFTHAIGGLSKNDFILAARIDRL